MAVRVWINYNGSADLCIVDRNYGHTLHQVSRHATADEAYRARDIYLRANPGTFEYGSDQ